MHLFHKWSMWMTDKEEYCEEKRIYYADGNHPIIYRFYRIHDRRKCETCGKVEYRIRETS